MSDNKEQAFQDLRWLHDRFKGVLALMDDLKDVGSLDQATKEAGDRLKLTLLNQKEADAKLAELEKKLQRKESDVVLAIADETAKQRKAHEEALSAEHKTAVQAAEKIIDSAHADRIKTMKEHADISQGVALLKAARDNLGIDVAQRRAEHDALVAKVTQEKAILADVKRELDTLRKTLGMANGDTPGR